jgi:uncharacterized membrane protein
MKKIDNLTKWFLQQKPLKIFLLILLGFPFIIWLFSISYQINKTTNKRNQLENIILGILTLYPLIFFSIFFMNIINITEVNTFEYYEQIRPYTMIAAYCLLILTIFAARNYSKYEKLIGIKSYETIVVFFMLYFYIVGVWVLQPKLNEYFNEKNRERRTTANNA